MKNFSLLAYCQELSCPFIASLDYLALEQQWYQKLVVLFVTTSGNVNLKKRGENLMIAGPTLRISAVVTFPNTAWGWVIK